MNDPVVNFWKHKKFEEKTVVQFSSVQLYSVM